LVELKKDRFIAGFHL
jgi:hypothetical protein